MDKGELSKIAVLFGKWWDYVLSAVKFPFNILDEEHCMPHLKIPIPNLHSKPAKSYSQLK